MKNLTLTLRDQKRGEILTNTPQKGGQELKQALLPDMKSNGWPMPASFDRFESFIHDELNSKHCHFSCSRPPDVVGVKIFDKDDQAAR